MAARGPRGAILASPGAPFQGRVAGRLCAALVAAALAVLLGACSPGRTFEAVGLLTDLATGEPPAGIERAAFETRVEGRALVGDLYRKRGGRAKAGLVVVPGASPRGRDDPRLVAFARTLAGADFLVLVPEIENLRRLNISSGDIGTIADALRHLHSVQPEGEQLGVVAISYAVGPALLAARRPGLRARVDLAIAVGGYFDSKAAATFFTTGHFRDPESGEWRYRAPNSYGKWIFVRANAGRLESARDRALLRAMAERRLEDPDAELADLAAELGPEGRAVYRFLTNRDPERAAALIAELPPAVREEMAALDLSTRDWSGPGPEILAIHGRADSIIPYSESIALVEAVNADSATDRARLYLVDGLLHVELDAVSADDALTLVSAIYRMLAIRDRPPAPGAAAETSGG